MNTITKITIEFENCESITLPSDVLLQCYLGKINTEISRIAINGICKITFADEIALGISFPEAEERGLKNPIFKENDKIFDRLTRHKDITHITVYYNNNTEETYSIDYNEESPVLGAPNINQKNYVFLGNLYIIIAANKDLDDFFDKDSITDERYINDIKYMYKDGD